MSTTAALDRETPPSPERIPVIDCDVHNFQMPEAVSKWLPDRWSAYLKMIGARSVGELGVVRARPGAARTDAWPPNGMIPGEDPDFAREQLLDAWDLDYALLNNSAGNAQFFIGGNQPAELSVALMHAVNEFAEEAWLGTDSRWLASICVPFEQPAAAAKEIALRREGELRDRWVQVLLADRTEKPIGNAKYWDLWEAAAHYGVPVALHPGGMGMNQVTACGWPSYYFEDHVGYPQAVFSQLASLIFEGVLDRWPNLSIVIAEGGYSWAVPFAWRLDAVWRVLKDEVPDLERKPSEYLRDHLWFTSQPLEEPEDPKWFAGLYEQLEQAGMGDRLMFSSDYPHWDFDPPREALPKSLPEEARRRILGSNASALYGVPLGS